MLINFFNIGTHISKWALQPIWIFFCFTSISAQTELVINGDLEDIRKMPLPMNMAIDGIRLEFEEDSSYFQPLTGAHSKLTPIAAPGWQYTTYDSIRFSANYSSVGYSNSGTNLKTLKIYRGSIRGYDAHVSNAVASLCRPMLKGKQYEVSFYLKPLSGTAFTNNIGVVITDEKIPFHFQFPQEKPKKKDKAPALFHWEADYKIPEILTDTTSYTKYSFTYTASGDELYVYIGNIFFDSEDFWKQTSWQKTPFYGYEAHNGRYFICYYALDDVSVLPLDPSEVGCNNNISTPEVTLWPDTMYLGSCYYKTDSSITQVDVAAMVEQIDLAPDDYKIMVIGHTDSEGTLEYNIKLSIKRSEGIKLVLQQLTTRPIFSIGLGDTNPLYQGIESEKNRRVDVYLVRE